MNKRNRAKSSESSGQERASETMPMPVPPSGQTDQSNSSAKMNMGMPAPRMPSTTADDGMPRPGGSSSIQSSPASSVGGPGQMPIPGFNNQPANNGNPNASGPDHGEPALPRFGSSGNDPAPRGGASYEPGVVEVQFKEGLVPKVEELGNASQIVSESLAPMDEVNRLLDQYQLISAEPTFLTTHDEATAAQETAFSKGIDAPHLAHFVTMRFPDEANTAQIAAELNALPQVVRAMPVPTALPPSITLDRPLELEDEPFMGDDSDSPPAGPLSEPLVGSSDQVVVNPGTSLENQWYIFRCRANTAWSRSQGENVVIADIDWGCRTSHQDFAGKIDKTYNAVDGTTDVTHGGSVYHGTGVMGLAGAGTNGKGIAGFAPNSRLWVVQGDSGTGTSLGGNAWARGIDWVRTTDSGGRRKVIILEVQTGAFGNYEQVLSVNAAIKTAIAAGVVVCVAAGNGDKDAGLDDSGQPIPETGSILVGATAYAAGQNKRAWFSNYGSRITVSAPGDSDHDLTCDSASDTAYRNRFGGTSGATPKVAGVAALLLATKSTLTHDQIRTILKSSGSAVVPDAGKPIGTFLNAEAAVNSVVAGGRLEVFARGSDKAVWHRWQTAPNNGWSGWASLGGWVDLISTGRNADGRLEIFARGSDAAVWHNWQTSGGWSGWSSLGGWVDMLAMGKNADGRLELFARGSDKSVWHRWQTAPNSGWSSWASLGGWIDRLTVDRNQDGRMELFVRGSDGAVWHNWQTAPNGGWSGWSSLGGWVDMIATARNADGRLEIFARGGDGAVWHNWQTAPNGGWSGWSSLGGWVDMISLGRNADGRLEIFARGSDKALWHKWQTAPNGGWSGWASMGGWIDRLVVNNNADGRLEVFARGSDNAVWHIWQTAPSNGWSSWASLGGWIDMISVDQNAN